MAISTTTATLRVATVGDAVEVLRVTLAAFGDYSDEQPVLSALQETEADVLQWLERGFMLVAEREGQVVGAVRLMPLEDGEWYLGRLAVLQSRRERGVGSALMSEAEREVTERGGRSIQLGVRITHTALPPWYERRGYRRFGVTEADSSGYPGTIYYRKEIGLES